MFRVARFKNKTVDIRTRSWIFERFAGISRVIFVIILWFWSRTTALHRENLSSFVEVFTRVIWMTYT